MSCFESALEEHAFDISTQGFALNLPANVSAFTPGLREDLARQMDSATASISSLAHHCVARSGELLPFLGKLMLELFNHLEDAKNWVQEPSLS